MGACAHGATWAHEAVGPGGFMGTHSGPYDSTWAISLMLSPRFMKLRRYSNCFLIYQTIASTLLRTSQRDMFQISGNMCLGKKTALV